MSGTDLTSVIEIGQRLLSEKLFITSMNCLWIYNYFLTLGDEIKYAWSGRKSRAFALFITIRYTPAVYILWDSIIWLHYSKSFCQATKWAMVLYTTVIAFLAQIIITLRIYAVTGRNKLLGGSLSVMTVVQFIFGIYYAVRIAMGPIQQFPEIDLEAYRYCFYQRWRPAEFIFVALMVTFDVFTFFIIFVTAKKQGTGYPGIPNLLDTILRDARVYFLLMFACQICLLLFLLFAPDQVQIMPVVTNATLIPIMGSRLMLSLKKASAEPREPWFLSAVSNIGGGIPQESTILRFNPRTTEWTRRIRGSTDQSILGEQDIELEPRK